MDFDNSTHLDSRRLAALFLDHTAPYRHERLRVRVRYSRGAAFSGTCYYRDSRIFVNLGRRNGYPFLLATGIARAQSNRTHWWRDVYRLVLADAYQLALFVYLHELYHYLVKAARRNTRRKEAMCDRFAARVLVDRYGCPLIDPESRAVPRERWDFQDLGAFVAAAPKEPRVAVVQPIPGTAAPAAAAVAIAEVGIAEFGIAEVGIVAAPSPRVIPVRVIGL
jgi:hypothetical protein